MSGFVGVIFEWAMCACFPIAILLAFIIMFRDMKESDGPR